MAKVGGVSQKPPVIEKIGKPPCLAKPDPPIRRAKLGGKFLGFFREFSGKLEIISKT